MYDESKGLIAIATGYSDGKYTYEKLNHDLLQQDTIQSTPDQMQDKDSKDSDGTLQIEMGGEYPYHFRQGIGSVIKPVR